MLCALAFIMIFRGGHYNEQVDKSFRWGMFWFIFSEVMFFAAFFGALFYARFFAIPWLGGEGEKLSTHAVLWPAFEALWPLLKLPDAKGFTTALEPMGARGCRPSTPSFCSRAAPPSPGRTGV